MRLQLVLFAVSSCLWVAQFAAAETRVALIIGNSDYADAPLKLANPANDAAAMKRALQDAGFDTIVKINAKRQDFYRMVDEFAAKIGRDPHAVGLFYYAGHGVQADGVNYLIPVDAQIESDADLEANAFDAERVLSAMRRAQNEMNIVILDACRDNPLPKTRGAERGLARMDAPSGTFIAYAAAPGQTAHDGAKGANGVFTGELVKAMAAPGVPLEQMFKRVIAGVRGATNQRQVPWSEASIQGDFYFHASVAEIATPRPGIDPKQIEMAFWNSIKDSKNAADYQAYQEKYPQGDFAALAANRVKLLQTARQPATKAPPIAASATNPAPTQTPAAVPASVQAQVPALPPAKPVSGRPPRCASILERAQLGEMLNDDERAYIKEKCQ